MGDPRKFKSKYAGPIHPWHLGRMEEEFVIVREFGFKNKRELWKISSKLKEFSHQAKRLIALRTAQAELESKQLIERVARYGLLSAGAKLDDVLGLTLRDLLNRRLGTIILKKGFARTANQARQFIVHGHVLVGDKKITSPNYLVPVDEEAKICFVASSSLASPEHPERYVKPKHVEVKAEVKSDDKSADKKDDKKVDKKDDKPKSDKKSKPRGEQK